MTRSIFGWDLPPGVTQRMIDEAAGGDEPCRCCGRDVGDCICPECPVCGECGNPACYDPGHESDDVRLCGKLEYNNRQLIGQTKAEIDSLREQILDHERYIAYLEDGPGMGPDGELNIEEETQD